MLAIMLASPLDDRALALKVSGIASEYMRSAGFDPWDEHVRRAIAYGALASFEMTEQARIGFVRGLLFGQETP
jgi:hypothetical protein